MAYFAIPFFFEGSNNGPAIPFASDSCEIIPILGTCLLKEAQSDGGPLTDLIDPSGKVGQRDRA